MKNICGNCNGCIRSNICKVKEVILKEIDNYKNSLDDIIHIKVSCLKDECNRTHIDSMTYHNENLAELHLPCNSCDFNDWCIVYSNQNFENINRLSDNLNSINPSITVNLFCSGYVEREKSI